ncbi:MAG: 50S ribosomal protein L11 methyltransferase [Gammaproteobacteria bacterium]|nr:50S ribosomal protein L11 methyltransferase [Gammaproteobacteria bacterium]
MPWHQLTLFTTKENAETLLERLERLGAVSVTMQDAADQPLYEPPPGATPLWQLTNVVGLFEEEANVDGVLAALRADYGAALPEYRLELLADQAWERAWMDDFKPMRFGRRLWIVPSWSEAPDTGGVNILLDPGLAFGTGTHPTTRLCLEWLDGHDIAGKRVIDYGCGSGILAIAAALLGAAAVVGVDNDPQAITATKENAHRNTVRAQIAACLPGHEPTEPVDLLLANILAGPLAELASLFAQRVKSGGGLVLSGILPEQAEGLREVYGEWFKMASATELDGWIRLEGVRRSPTES